MDDIKRNYLRSLEEEKNEALKKHSKSIKTFISYCSNIGLNLSIDNFDYIRPIGIIAKYPNLLFLINSELQKVDEDLLDCSLLNKMYIKKRFNSGTFYSDNYIALAHPYFRRGFSESANFSPRFIELFWQLNNNNIDTYIALDPNRVRVNIDDSAYFEHDTWYGASFKKEINQIPNGTVKIRPPSHLENTLISFYFNDAYSFDVKWTEKDGIKTFQAEELKTEDVKIVINGIGYHPVRYIHAEYDLNKKCFRHFDGALHFYTEDEYQQRKDSDLNFNEKIGTQIKAKSYKLFKMNKNVNIDTWITFTSHFCTGNPLVFEYFEGMYPDHIQDILEAIKNKASG